MPEVQPVRALERGLRLLEVLAGAPEEGRLGVVEAAGRADLSPATAHRLLATLCACGYVTQDASHERYRLGPRLFALASAAETELIDVRERARPVMRRLCTELGETVNLSVLNQHSIIYVEQVESDRPLRAFNRIGNRVPAHASAAGKALLAFEPDGASILEAALEPLTAATITSADALSAQLAEIRKSGYAMDLGEHDEDVICVAAPISGPGRRPIAALSISGPAERLRRLDLRKLGGLVAAYAAEVEFGPSE
jgi:DNA-binding IclR family transcriptional regulator